MSILFTPFKINGLEIKNRFIRSATHEGMATREGLPTQELSALYNALAEGGIGLIITGGAHVEGLKHLPHIEGAGYPLVIESDRYIEDWKKITESVHRRGARIVMQIFHLGKLGNPCFWKMPPIDPVAVKEKRAKLQPHEMSAEKIRDIIEKFAQACRRTQEAGFDGVQLHGCHGRLISNFLSPHLNTRKDSLGGSTENRARIILEIVQRARELVGPSYPIMIKMNGDDFIPGGLTPDEATRVAVLIVNAGIDSIEVSGGLPESWLFIRSIERNLAKGPEKEAYFKSLASTVKQSVHVPVALVGGLRSKSVMEKTIKNGVADFVSMSRPFIREPDFVKQLEEVGSSKSTCISCNRCMRKAFVQSLRCYDDRSMVIKR